MNDWLFYIILFLIFSVGNSLIVWSVERTCREVKAIRKQIRDILTKQMLVDLYTIERLQNKIKELDNNEERNNN